MATNYSPTIVTDGLKYSGDPLMPSTAENGSSRLYDNVGAKSSEVKFLLSAANSAGKSFTDSSLSNHTITAYGDVTCSSTESRFNDSSIKFDGTGDYLTLADSDDWSFGDGDFTIDFWVYPTDNSTNYQGLITQVPSETGTGMWIEYNAGTLRLFVRNGSGDLFTEINGSMVKDNWHHVAVVRKENTMYLFKDGYSQGSSSYSGTWPNFSASVYIGYRNSYGHFTGYMDQIRIVKGTALYDTTFVPPTRPSSLDLYDGMMRTANQLDFDGTDDKVSYGDVTWIDGATNITFACWVYLEGSPPGAGGVLLSKDNALECWVKQSSSDQFVMSINNNHVAFDSDAPEIRLWTHVAMTWNSTGDVRKLYLNGQLKSTKTTGTQSGNSINNTSEGLAIGSRDANNYEIDGQISDVRLFNKTLNADQIKQICNNPKVIVPDNLSISDYVFYAPLSEGTGTVAYDASGRQRYGTLTGADWVAGRSGANQLIQGYNRPMLFDGNNDYVAAGNPAALKFTWADNFSLSAWIWRSSAAGGGDFDHIIGKTYGNYRLALNGQQLSFRLNSNGLIAASGASDIPNNTWTHVAATWATNSSDGGTAKIYINGSLNATQTGTANWTDGGADFQIGNSYGESYYFTGLINECIAYNKTLSLAEVQVLAATGPNGGPLPPDPRDLSDSSNALGYWRNDGTVSWPNLGSSANVGAGTPSGSPSALLFVEGYNGQNNTKSGRDSQGFPLKHKNVGAMGFISDSFVSVPSIGTSGEFSNCTISIWFNKQNQIDSYGNLFDCNFDITDYNKGPRMEIHIDNSTIRLYLAADNGNYYSAPAGTFSNDIWTNITWKITTIGTSKQIVTPYINGVNSYEATEQTNSSYFWDGDIGALNIGRGFSSGRTFTGDIGNFRIYNRGLSAAEILQNYNAQKSRFT